jgi:hypothetical protein
MRQIEVSAFVQTAASRTAATLVSAPITSFSEAGAGMKEADLFSPYVREAA